MGVYGPHSFEACASDAKQRNALSVDRCHHRRGPVAAPLAHAIVWLDRRHPAWRGGLADPSREAGLAAMTRENPIAADAMSVELGYREKQILRLLLRG